uniref:SIAH-type domain-containing protein n=1 Tax=Oryza nivara TaxID=4536 RepID=A0A0E0FFK4_ORYNI
MDHGTAKKTRSVKKVAGLCTDQQQDVEEETTKMTYSIDSDSLIEFICARTGTPRAAPAASSWAGNARAATSPSATSGAGRWRRCSLPCPLPASSGRAAARRPSATPRARSHEASCPHAPCRCPFDGCTYLGLLLYNHILDEHATDAVVAMGSLRHRGITVTVHKSKPFHVVLHRGGTRVFLLLNGGDVLSGRSLSLVSVGPPPPGNCELRYKIELAAVGPGQGELALSASGTVPCVRQLDVFEAKAFLFVPEAYWGSSGTVSVTVHI